MQKIDSKQLELLLKRICYDRQIDKKDIAVALDIKPQTLSDYTGGKKIKNVKSIFDKVLEAYPEYRDFAVAIQTGTSISSVVINGSNSNSPIDNRQYYSDSPDVLRAQIDILDERIKEKDAQIKEKDAQINRLLDILASKS